MPAAETVVRAARAVLASTAQMGPSQAPLGRMELAVAMAAQAEPLVRPAVRVPRQAPTEVAAAAVLAAMAAMAQRQAFPVRLAGPAAMAVPVVQGARLAARRAWLAQMPMVARVAPAATERQAPAVFRVPMLSLPAVMARRVAMAAMGALGALRAA